MKSSLQKCGKLLSYNDLPTSVELCQDQGNLTSSCGSMLGIIKERSRFF